MAGKKIEDVINGVLKEDARKNALDFVAYLRMNEIPIGESDAYWEVNYKGENVCFLWIDGAAGNPGPWTIWSDQWPGTWAAFGEHPYTDFPLEEGIRKLAWANVNICGNCGGCENPGGTTKTVLGRVFDNVCNSTMAFTNPTAEALCCAKKMIDVRKMDIDNL